MVHDIEEARSQGWASTFITLDVQGAFDAVSHRRLIRRMQSQGWPEHIMKWIKSFLAIRSVQVRYSEFATEKKKLTCVTASKPRIPIAYAS